MKRRLVRRKVSETCKNDCKYIFEILLVFLLMSNDMPTWKCVALTNAQVVYSYKMALLRRPVCRGCACTPPPPEARKVRLMGS